VNREELVALHAALSTVLTWPEPVLEQVAAWLTPDAPPKPGNGLDHDPPRVASPPRPTHAAKPAKANAGERKLLAAMESSPGASANALAKAAGMSRSTAADGLQRLAKRGAIEKDAAGRWRLFSERASPAEAAPRPIQPSPAAS
jgi:hypothetical protein